MPDTTINKVENKFKTEDPIKDLHELLHISSKLNYHINNYFEFYGGGHKGNIKKWNDLLSEKLKKMEKK